MCFCERVSSLLLLFAQGVRDLQIFVEYQIYCLFGSSLTFKLCCQIWQHIQIDKLKASENGFSYRVKTHLEIVYFFPQLVRWLYSKIISPHVILRNS